ncbi:MotE family protein [Gaopeijia maritima]|uniref:MotE family protein n=1 Tax=Gaopeijia maritima TaxID=3119007 RepID=UPI00327B6D13
MKTVILALMGVLVGGGVGTGGGAFLLARCSTDAPEGALAEGGHDDAEGGEAATDSAAVEAVDEAVDSLEADPTLLAEADAEAEDEADPVDDVDGAETAAATVDGEPAPPEAGPTAADLPPTGAIDPVAPAVEPLVLAPTPDPTALRRLARIFSNMRAEQAAAVMVELTDEEAQRILVSMSERSAAAILGKMEASRAAVLSQKVLGAAGGGDR